MKLTTTLAAAAVALTGLVGAASAATEPFEIGFATFPTSSFDGASYGPIGSVSFANNCDKDDNNDKTCAQLSNNQTLRIWLTGPGTFTITGFQYNGTGSADGSVLVSNALNGSGDTFTETNGSNDMTSVTIAGYPFVAPSPVTSYSGLTEIYFKNVGNGSARIDNITGYITTPAVPVPAAGFLLVGALGALGVARKRRAA